MGLLFFEEFGEGDLLLELGPAGRPECSLIREAESIGRGMSMSV